MGITRTAPTADAYAPPADDGLTAENEDAAPTRSSSVTRRGWGAAKKVKEEASEFNDFKVTEETQLVKFLDDEPYASYAQHWVDEVKDGKKSWTCIGKKCPLCGVGNKKRAMALFNVVVVDESLLDGTPTVKTLECGPMLSDLIEENHNDRGGPLSKHYWTLRKKKAPGANGKVSYFMTVVKAAELADDFGLDPAEVKAALTGLKGLDETSLQFPTAEKLAEIRDEYLVD